LVVLLGLVGKATEHGEAAEFGCRCRQRAAGLHAENEGAEATPSAAPAPKRLSAASALSSATSSAVGFCGSSSR
jgi:hypothetical protein